jgi:uncharacterized protein
MRIVRNGEFATLPWKNGLGVSRVIASHPDTAGYETVDWQVGTTDIAIDCPFSSLPGMDRQFTVLSGAGVELTCVDVISGVNVRKAVDRPFAPFAFRGEWQTTCRMLGDAVTVFNVMTRRGHASARIALPRWTGALYCEQPKGETVLAVVLAGTVQLAAEMLSPTDTVVLDAKEGERCELTTAGEPARVAIVRVSPVER